MFYSVIFDLYVLVLEFEKSDISSAEGKTAVLRKWKVKS